MGTSPDVAPVDGATCADTSPAAAIRNVDRMKTTFFMMFVLCVCVEFLFSNDVTKEVRVQPV